MVLRVEPLAAALDAARERALPGSEIRSILLSPQGRIWDQPRARELASSAAPERPLTLIFISGNYEGPDERFRELVDEEISIGDYVLTGGELPALVVANSLLRLLPGTIEADSRENDSFSAGRLDYPVYTRPLV
nr:tRNA (guanine-N(1)-)-methyltransferase-like [Lytechinus pictus]